MKNLTIAQLATLNFIRENVYWNMTEAYLPDQVDAETFALVKDNEFAMNSTLDVREWAREKFGISLSIEEVQTINRHKIEFRSLSGKYSI